MVKQDPGARTALISPSPHVYELVTVVTAAVAVWLTRWWLTGLAPVGGDGPFYLAISRGEEVVPPWSFHILTPWLARSLSPSDPLVGFHVIAALSFLTAAVGVWWLMTARSLDLAPAERAYGAFLFMATYPGVAMQRAYWMTDPLSYALLAVACGAVAHRRDGILALVCLVGVFNRETALFVGLTAVFWAGRYPLTRGGIVRQLAWAGAVFGPAVVGYLILHHTSLVFGHLPPHLNYLHPDVVRRLWADNLRWLGTSNVPLGLALCVFLSYGPLWLLSAAGIVTRPGLSAAGGRLVLALWLLAVPTALSLLVVDWRRGFQPLFPAVITSAVLGTRWAAGTVSGLPWKVAAISTVVATIAVTEAWWAPRISVQAGIAMAFWLAVTSAVALRRQQLSRLLSIPPTLKSHS